MTEALIYTVVGLLLYFVSDVSLKAIERVHGEPIPHRNIVFFVIILTLAVFVFQIIGAVLA